jgi:lipopolysaccharide biosynthesis protein
MTNIKKNIAVVLYLYHTDLWPEFESLLVDFSNNIKLYLGLSNKDKNNTTLINKINSNFLTSITYHDNFGADVAPFVEQISNVDEPYFIKIHSKKSTLGNNKQINWRTILLHSFLGSKDIFNNNLDLITQPDIGSVGNENFLIEWENTNSKKIKYLCNLLNVSYNNINNRLFFAGNMFLSKTQIYKNFLQPYQKDLLNLLANEKNKVNDNNDGTFTHSLERLFGYLISYNNLKFNFSKLPNIRIKNTLAPDGYFNMIFLYNNDCYLKEDINVYGNIKEYKPNNYIIIEWKHTNKPQIQNYKFIKYNTIIKT